MLRESMTKLDRTQDSIAASTSVLSSTLALSLPASTIHVEMLVALDKQLGNFASNFSMPTLRLRVLLRYRTMPRAVWASPPLMSCGCHRERLGAISKT